MLRALGISGVPATGYFGEGWSIGTMLLLYWLETVLVTVVVAALILRHRRATRKAGHWNAQNVVTTTRNGRTTRRSGKTTFLASFLGVMIGITLFLLAGLLFDLVGMLPDRFDTQRLVRA